MPLHAGVQQAPAQDAEVHARARSTSSRPTSRPTAAARRCPRATSPTATCSSAATCSAPTAPAATTSPAPAARSPTASTRRSSPRPARGSSTPRCRPAPRACRATATTSSPPEEKRAITQYVALHHRAPGTRAARASAATARSPRAWSPGSSASPRSSASRSGSVRAHDTSLTRRPTDGPDLRRRRRLDPRPAASRRARATRPTRRRQPRLRRQRARRSSRPTARAELDAHGRSERQEQHARRPGGRDERPTPRETDCRPARGQGGRAQGRRAVPALVARRRRLLRLVLRRRAHASARPATPTSRRCWASFMALALGGIGAGAVALGQAAHGRRGGRAGAPPVRLARRRSARPPPRRSSRASQRRRPPAPPAAASARCARRRRARAAPAAVRVRPRAASSTRSGCSRTTAWTQGMRLVRYNGTPVRARRPADRRASRASSPTSSAAPQLRRLPRAAHPHAPRGAPARGPRGVVPIEGHIAYSSICTHLGCPVKLYEQQTHNLLCPCHQSTFDAAGAPRSCSARPPGRCLNWRSASTTRDTSWHRATSPSPSARPTGSATHEPSSSKAADGTGRWVDDRLGSSNFVRRSLNKVFPDHWSFMLGEIALYSFIILLLSGTYLAFFYTPSLTEVVYDGSYIPLVGVPMSDSKL